MVAHPTRLLQLVLCDLFHMYTLKSEHLLETVLLYPLYEENETMTMFARKTTDGDYALFYDDGTVVTTLLDDWPIVWPVDSPVSAYHEHPEGIVLPDHEYVKIAKAIPLEN